MPTAGSSKEKAPRKQDTEKRRLPVQRSRVKTNEELGTKAEGAPANEARVKVSQEQAAKEGKALANKSRARFARDETKEQDAEEGETPEKRAREKYACLEAAHQEDVREQAAHKKAAKQEEAREKKKQELEEEVFDESQRGWKGLRDFDIQSAMQGAAFEARFIAKFNSTYQTHLSTDRGLAVEGPQSTHSCIGTTKTFDAPHNVFMIFTPKMTMCYVQWPDNTVDRFSLDLNTIIIEYKKRVNVSDGRTLYIHTSSDSKLYERSRPGFLWLMAELDIKVEFFHEHIFFFVAKRENWGVWADWEDGVVVLYVAQGRRMLAMYRAGIDD